MELPKLSDFQEGTIAWILQRYRDEMDGVDGMPGLKPLGLTHGYAVLAMQKRPIAKKKAGELRKADFIEHCKERRKTVGAATVNQDISILRGALTHAASAWDDLEEISAAATAALAVLNAAKPLLNKYQLIGKSRPRSRRPTEEELERLMAYFRKQNENARTQVPMDVILEFSYTSARRISETCRLRWGDVNGAEMTCVVRDMKDPKNKKGNDHVFPLLGRAWDIVMAQPRLTDDPDERIFPYHVKTCCARYTRAKHALGIKDLRLHDNRREAASRAFEGRLNGRKYGVPEVMVITGHKNPQMLMRVYTKLNARDLHVKPADAAPLEQPTDAQQ